MYLLLLYVRMPYLYECVFAHEFASYGIYMMVRGQILRVCSLLLPLYGFWGSNLVVTHVWKTILPAVSSPQSG
ncbi:Uncharacterised protein [Chlamydia trachomatis]|nr:Uncharacterised protein [Chlamydia trachomatis]